MLAHKTHLNATINVESQNERSKSFIDFFFSEFCGLTWSSKCWLVKTLCWLCSVCFPSIQASRKHVSKFREDAVWLQNRTSPTACQLDLIVVSLGLIYLACRCTNWENHTHQPRSTFSNFWTIRIGAGSLSANSASPFLDFRYKLMNAMPRLTWNLHAAV